MKHFCKQLFTVFVLSIMMITMAICFVACDDSDGNDNENEPLTFAEGTTIEDIVRMANDGDITSCTQKFYVKKSGEYVLQNKVDISCNIAVSYMFDNYGNEMKEYTVYTVYSPEKGKEYIIGNLQASSDGAGYYWRNSDNEPIDVLKNLSRDEEIVNSIIIEKNIISYTLNNGFVKVVISNINSTTVQLSDEYSDYKELAVELPSNI